MKIWILRGRDVCEIRPRGREKGERVAAAAVGSPQKGESVLHAGRPSTGSSRSYSRRRYSDAHLHRGATHELLAVLLSRVTLNVPPSRRNLKRRPPSTTNYRPSPTIILFSLSYLIWRERTNGQTKRGNVAFAASTEKRRFCVLSSNILFFSRVTYFIISLLHRFDIPIAFSVEFVYSIELNMYTMKRIWKYINDNSVKSDNFSYRWKEKIDIWQLLKIIECLFMTKISLELNISAVAFKSNVWKYVNK